MVGIGFSAVRTFIAHPIATTTAWRQARAEARYEQLVGASDGLLARAVVHTPTPSVALAAEVIQGTKAPSAAPPPAIAARDSYAKQLDTPEHRFFLDLNNW